jgi:hypothetical protein
VYACAWLSVLYKSPRVSRRYTCTILSCRLSLSCIPHLTTWKFVSFAILTYDPAKGPRLHHDRPPDIRRPPYRLEDPKQAQHHIPAIQKQRQEAQRNAPYLSPTRLFRQARLDNLNWQYHPQGMSDHICGSVRL